MKKIILAMVDNTGVRATGRYRDRLCQLAETEAVLEARACVWSDHTKGRLEQIERHIEEERSSHLWIGYFVLPNTKDVLATARDKAMRLATNPAPLVPVRH